MVVLNLFPQENKLKLVREIDAIYLDYDIAMRLAIALNELICNAIEHGLLQSETPELTVSVKRSEQQLELIVRDNGPGFTEQHLQANSINGQGLIVKLLHKVNGTIRYSNDQGCVATVHVDL